MKTSELREIIRRLVREELTKLAPLVVEEFLTEKYLKTIVERNVKSSNLAERLASELAPSDENETPEPPENDHLGIYNDRPPIQNESVRRLLSSSQMANVYEGVKPIPSQQSPILSESERQFGPAGVPVDKIPGFNKRMKELMQGASSMSSQRTEMRPASMEAEERRLAKLRAELDVPVAQRPKVQ